MRFDALRVQRLVLLAVLCFCCADGKLLSAFYGSAYSPSSSSLVLNSVSNNLTGAHAHNRKKMN